MSNWNVATENAEAQKHNLCNTCEKLWEDCGMLDARTTRRIVFHPRSSGYLVTTRCSGYRRWSKRVLALMGIQCF